MLNSRFKPLVISVCGIVLIGLIAITPTTAQPLATPTPPPPLSAQIGFSDPEFDKLEAAGFTVLNQSLTFNAHQHQYRLMTVNQNIKMAAPGGLALLYQIDGVPTLRWSQDYLKLHWQTPFILNDFLSSLPTPNDWNHDGRLLFAVHGDHDGTIWDHSVYYIYELLPNGNVISRLAGNIHDGFIVIKIELNQPTNQSVLLTAWDVRNEMAMGTPNCCGPSVKRYYVLRADTVTDISPRLKYRYDEDLNRDLAYLKMTTVVSDNDAKIYAIAALQTLMIYDALQQREVGWQLLQNIVSDAKRNQRLPAGTYMDTTFMPTMKRLFEENKDFIAPEYADPAENMHNYYVEPAR